MQTANGTFILSPENHQPVRNVTPAEVLMFYRMHFANANGSPLGEFFIQDGEAQTVDVEGTAAQPAYRDNQGRQFESKDAVPAVTHDRTQEEEIDKLKRKFTGNISVDGKAMGAFAATFGSEIGVRLPETFDEIARMVGSTKERPLFKLASETAVDQKTKSRRDALSQKLRADLCTMAVNLGLAVHPQDDKNSIVNAIIEKEKEPIEMEPAPLARKSKKELLDLAEQNGVEVKSSDSKDAIIAAITADEDAKKSLAN